MFDLFCSSTVCPVAWLLLYFQGKKRKLSYVVQIVLEKVITQTNGNAAGRDSCHSYHECTRAKVCCTILFICTCTGTIVCCPIVFCTIVQLYTQTHGCLCVLPLLFRCPGLSHSRRQGLFVPDKRNTSTRIYFGWNAFYENSHEE